MGQFDWRSGQWRERAASLLHDCAASAPADEADRLREAFLLLGEANFADAGPSDQPCAQDFGRLLACQAHDSAAIALLGQDTSFLVSRAGGTCLATVLRPGRTEAWGEGATPALALLCANLACLAEGSDTVGPGAGKRSSAISCLN